MALLVIPVLSELVLKQVPEREFGFIRRFHAGYRALLDRAIARPKRTITLSFALLVVAGALTPLVGTEFMPALDEGAIAINVVRLPNASIQGSVEVARYLEKRLKSYPEVETVVSKTGRAEISEDPMGPEQTDVFVMLKPRRPFGGGRSRVDLAQAMQLDLSQIPGLRFSFSQPIALRVNELISGVKSDLAVKVFGTDLALLKGFADRIAVAVGGVRGATDVKVEQVSGLNQYDVVIDREAAARHGIAVGDINDTIESAIAGKAATTLIEDQRRFAVVIRFPPESRSDIAQVGQLLVAAPGGERVPLSQLATIRLVEAPAQVSRENGIRRVVVEANIRGRDLGGFVAEVQERLKPFEKEMPPGTFLEVGGQFENQQRAMRTLAIVVPIALALILLLLYLALGTFGDALLVLLNLPFSLVGGGGRGGAVSDAGLGVSRCRVHRPPGHRGPERRRADRVSATASGPGDGSHRGRAGGVQPALPASPHDRAHELHRALADALRAGLGSRHPEAARRGRDGRARHVHDPHVARPARHLLDPGEAPWGTGRDRAGEWSLRQ